jgi:hypothetical protein
LKSESEVRLADVREHLQKKLTDAISRCEALERANATEKVGPLLFLRHPG